MCERHNEIIQRRDKVAAKLNKLDGWLLSMKASVVLLQSMVDAGIKRTAEHDTFTEAEATALYSIANLIGEMNGTLEWDVYNLTRKYYAGGKCDCANCVAVSA